MSKKAVSMQIVMMALALLFLLILLQVMLPSISKGFKGMTEAACKFTGADFFCNKVEEEKQPGQTNIPFGGYFDSFNTAMRDSSKFINPTLDENQYKDMLSDLKCIQKLYSDSDVEMIIVSGSVDNLPIYLLVPRDIKTGDPTRCLSVLRATFKVGEFVNYTYSEAYSKAINEGSNVHSFSSIVSVESKGWFSVDKRVCFNKDELDKLPGDPLPVFRKVLSDVSCKFS